MAIKIKVLAPQTPEAALIATVKPQTTAQPVETTSIPVLTQVVQPTLMQALATSGQADDLPPWEAPENYTILDALKEHYDRQLKGHVLYLVSKSREEQFLVKSYSPETGRAILEGKDKMVLKPVIGAREVPLYEPFWR